MKRARFLPAIWVLGLLAGPALDRSGVAMGETGGLPSGSSQAGAAELKWATSFQTAMEEARAEQKFVMVDFYTHWCYWCKVLDAKTYVDPRVVATGGKLVSVKVNAEADVATATKYGVRAYPTILFLNPDGSVRQRIQGFRPPEAFLPVLEQVLDTSAELYGLGQQVLANPQDRTLRSSYGQALVRSGNIEAALAQVDTLLMLKPLQAEEKASLELDRWILLHRGGKGSDARKGLEKWIKKAKVHPRRLEGEYFLAQAQEREGKRKEARKLYEDILRVGPGSWFAEVARSKLASG